MSSIAFGLTRLKSFHSTPHVIPGTISCNYDNFAEMFRTEVAVKMHMVTHFKEESYLCPLCDQMFRCDTSRQKHIVKDHRGLAPFECTDCDARFSSETVLKVHQYSHTGQYPFKCSVCGQGYLNDETHDETHRCFSLRSIKAQFKCSHCLRKFIEPYLLYQHQLMHHEVEKIQCPECEEQVVNADQVS